MVRCSVCFMHICRCNWAPSGVEFKKVPAVEVSCRVLPWSEDLEEAVRGESSLNEQWNDPCSELGSHIAVAALTAHIDPNPNPNPTQCRPEAAARRAAEDLVMLLELRGKMGLRGKISSLEPASMKNAHEDAMNGVSTAPSERHSRACESQNNG